MRKIELLAPARDLECGMEAVRHGADAVYIGAPRFGARAAASVSLEDISALVQYAHLYGVRVYVALNTILGEQEVEEARRLAFALYRRGVDALIVQDLALLGPGMPPIPLHASTQTDNRTSDKVAFLARAGMTRVVVARELPPADIARIHREVPDVELEAFVHGALCVSYSGQCYASCAMTGRSANRGECAQFCRLSFDLVDSLGRTAVKESHLLSLKDMNRMDQLEELLDAGVVSLKIEGRLKDKGYVKNVTAAYRLRLDKIFARRPEYGRASAGTCRFNFTPQPEKSFNRGFTPYLWNLPDGKRPEVMAMDAAGWVGEYMGTLKAVRGNCLVVSGTKAFHNGDGICLRESRGQVMGYRVNRVAEDGKLFLAGNQSVKAPAGTRIYRNRDQEFEQLLSRDTAIRKIRVRWELGETSFGFTLTLADEEGNRLMLLLPAPKEPARTPQEKNLRAELGKLGDTPFETDAEAPEGGILLKLQENWFIPASKLAAWRRQAVERLLQLRRLNYRQEYSVRKATSHPYGETSLTYLGNVMNSAARDFYLQHGVKEVAPAYEQQPVPAAALMFCRHCLRYELGWCTKRGGVPSPYAEPYYLVSSDGRRFRLQFDCRECRMLVYDANAPRKAPEGKAPGNKLPEGKSTGEKDTGGKSLERKSPKEKAPEKKSRVHRGMGKGFLLSLLFSFFFSLLSVSCQRTMEPTDSGRPYPLETNLELVEDSMLLECLPVKDCYSMLYRGDRVVVAEVAVHPADSVDSVWVKLAHSQEVQGWVREEEMLHAFVPSDSISQAIFLFSRTHLGYFIAIWALCVALRLLHRHTRTRPRTMKAAATAEPEFFYPWLLCLLTACCATLYESMQLFTPELWQRYYFAPTLSPLDVPLLLALFLSGLWLMLVVGLATVEVAFSCFSPAEALYHLMGVASGCIVCYFFFMLATSVYVGYFFLFLFFWLFFYRLQRSLPVARYHCGRCGAPLRAKGKCPHCGALNR